MDKESEKLNNINSEVQRRAEYARRNLKDMSPNGKDWLTSVDTTTEHVEGDNLWSRGDRLHARLMDQNSSVLVILDDLDLELERLGIPNNSNHNPRCKVIFITCSRRVCEAMGAQKIIDVGTLSEEKAWILFRQKVGDFVNGPSLLDTARKVAEECKGLPLAIITVAGALKNKSKSSWEDALVQLQRAAPRNIPGVDTNVYQSLRLISCDHLESDEARRLFLLCSLFEEDSDICPGELLRCGMGLHIFQGIKNIEEARKRVCSLLETLKDCFLLSQRSDEDDVKMHDVVRDVAIYIESEGNDIFMGGAAVEISGSPTEKAILQWVVNMSHFKEAIGNMAASNFRCVAIAYRPYEVEKVPTEEELDHWAIPEGDLILLAIVGIKDPCRPGVRDSVQLCIDAGVKVRMVTGDNLQTSRAIALECGILRSDADATEPNLIEGKRFRALSEEDRKEVADKISVMGRSSSNDKLLLVQALRIKGHVVAVTGDCTNDAPALHEVLFLAS